MNTDGLNASRKEPVLKLLGQRKMTSRLSSRSDLAQLGRNFPADLLREGACVVAYDPKGLEKARGVKTIVGAAFAASALEAVDAAEALIIATEWSEFANVDLAIVKKKMTTPIVFDGRNLFDPETMAQLGFRYHSIGRVSVKSD